MQTTEQNGRGAVTVGRPASAAFRDYHPDRGYDEAFGADLQPRPHYRPIADFFDALPAAHFERRRALAEIALRNQGITFTVNADPADTERILPFDVWPRVIPGNEWRVIEAGLIQRVRALNLFLHDLYHTQEVVSDGIIPAQLVLANPAFRREVHAIELPHDTYIHVAGIDIIRDESGQYRVLEDNLRIPSGASYMLANRRVMTRTFPELFAPQDVRFIEHYPDMLLATLRELSPRDIAEPVIVLLTPGPANSAYFEHMFLAQQMCIDLVEGSDLYVDEDRVWMRTTNGRRQVDVIYRRVDDDFLDPVAFRPDSLLGVPGLVQVYRHGHVALANAVGTGVADDKSMYAYVPQLIRYYLDEQPILPNVETFLGAEPDGLAYMIDHAADLVFKRVDQAGGYGMLIGPQATRGQIDRYVAQVRREPWCYIAQPLIELSTHPTFANDAGAFEPRRIDLRPFVLTGTTTRVAPGGLTRVALRRGSYVVNSSQGGGSKDTWVLEEPDAEPNR